MERNWEKAKKINKVKEEVKERVREEAKEVEHYREEIKKNAEHADKVDFK